MSRDEDEPAPVALSEESFELALPEETVVRLRRLMATDVADFRTLALAAGFDPETSFRGVDLSNVDFGNSDLTGLEFHNSPRYEVNAPTERQMTNNENGQPLEKAKVLIVLYFPDTPHSSKSDEDVLLFVSLLQDSEWFNGEVRPASYLDSLSETVLEWPEVVCFIASNDLSGKRKSGFYRSIGKFMLAHTLVPAVVVVGDRIQQSRVGKLGLQFIDRLPDGKRVFAQRQFNPEAAKVAAYSANLSFFPDTGDTTRTISFARYATFLLHIAEEVRRLRNHIAQTVS